MSLYGPFQGLAPGLDRLGKLLRFGIGKPAGGMVGPHRACQRIQAGPCRPADSLDLVARQSSSLRVRRPARKSAAHAGKAPPLRKTAFSA